MLVAGALGAALLAAAPTEAARGTGAQGRFDRTAESTDLWETLRTDPLGAFADDAALELGRRAARAGRLQEASRYLRWGARTHPDGDRIDAIRLLLAEIELRLGDAERARRLEADVRPQSLSAEERWRRHRLQAVLSGEQALDHLADLASIPVGRREPLRAGAPAPPAPTPKRAARAPTEPATPGERAARAPAEPARTPERASAVPSGAEPAPPSEDTSLEAEVERLRVTVADLEESRDAKAGEMAALRSLVEDLQASLNELREGRAEPAEPTSPDTPTVRPGPPDRTAVVQPPPAEEDEAEPPEEVGKAKEQARRFQVQREILERQGGVLLPQGQIVLEPRIQYANTTRNIVDVSGFSLIPALIIGELNIVDIDRDVYTANLGFRYGITNRLEFELNVPYLYRVDVIDITETEEPGRERSADYDIGDVNVGLFAHLLRETTWRPDVILNLRAKSRTGQDPFEISGNELATGSGTWAASAGLTFVKTVDPAVMFFSSSYFVGIERDIDLTDSPGREEFDPGDTFEYSLGLAFSLNERIAMTTSLQHRITNRSKVDGDKLLRSDANSATLFIGGSYRMNQWTTFNVSLGIGLNEDAPDFLLEMRIPWRLPYRVTFPDFAGLRLPRLSLPSFADIGLPFRNWFGGDDRDPDPDPEQVVLLP